MADDEYRRVYFDAVTKAFEKMEPGTGYLKAMGRMGLDEVAQALKAFPDSITPTPEMGAPGEPTPQEVYEQKSPLEQYQASLPEPSPKPEKEIER